MALTNYRDLSTKGGDVHVGFQYEFFCENCGDTWKSPFKANRSGQAGGLLRRFSFVLSEFAQVSAVTDMINRVSRATGMNSDTGSSKAGAAALEEALALAGQRYEKCTSCHSAVCANCFDESSGLCTKCQPGSGASARGSAEASAAVCPNCQTSSQGGRFCHECGFDMASTHKSCPSCGVTMPRQARFCTDCGHGF